MHRAVQHHHVEIVNDCYLRCAGTVAVGELRSMTNSTHEFRTGETIIKSYIIEAHDVPYSLSRVVLKITSYGKAAIFL